MSRWKVIVVDSSLTVERSLDAEISRGIVEASTAFGKLEKRVWPDQTRCI